MKAITMSYSKSYGKYGDLRYVFRASYKDPLDKEYKQIVRTFTVPKDVIGKTRKHNEFLLQCEQSINCEKEEILSKYKDGNYLRKQSEKIVFCDYAKQWIDDILVRDPESFHYHIDSLANLRFFQEHFKKLTLAEMTQKVVREFCDWLRVRTYKKYKVTSKMNIKKIIWDKGLTLYDVADACEMSIATIDEAAKIGASISIESAEKLCKFLDVKVSNCFDVVITEQLYSKSANNQVRWLLSSILGAAVKDGYIPINYASSEYIVPMTGVEKERICMKSQKEYMEFIKPIKEIENIRLKTILLISITLGPRVSEISGLSWPKIDLENKTIKINENVMDVHKHGLVKKGTKTPKSNRLIMIPDFLFDALVEYKQWWDNKKQTLGDAWLNNDYLFLNDEGRIITGNTINNWLKAYEQEHGFIRTTIHGIRHSVLSVLNNNKISRKSISKLAGHSNVATTDKYYINTFTEEDELVCDTLNNLLTEGLA